MHGIKSSYRSFRDSMGKNNPLRNLLETYLKAEDAIINENLFESLDS